MPPGASIVAISSLGAGRVLENYALIGTSKAALESLVRYLAVELAPDDPRQRRVRGRRRDGRARALPEQGGDAPRREGEPGRPARHPRGHGGGGRFLCSPDAEMIRGHVLVVDGGFSLTV